MSSVQYKQQCVLIGIVPVIITQRRYQARKIFYLYGFKNPAVVIETERIMQNNVALGPGIVSEDGK